MFNIGPLEFVVLAAVALIVFGPDKLPQLARGLGSAQREFKKGLEEGADDKSDKSKSD